MNKLILSLFIIAALYPVIIYADTITLTDTERIYQRNYPVIISGTYEGTPSSIQARIVLYGTSTPIVTWTTIDAAPAGGAFSGTLDVPAGTYQGAPCWYSIQVRYSNDTGVYDNGLEKIGVGMLWVLAGQSNGEGMFYRSSSPPTPSEYSLMYDNHLAGFWVTGSEGWKAVTGNGAIQLANNLVTRYKMPVGILAYAVGASAIYDHNSRVYWTNTADDSLYDDCIDGISECGGKIEGVIYWQGEAEAVDGVPSQWTNYIGTVIGNFRSATGQALLPFIINRLGPQDGYTTAENWGIVQAAQVSAENVSNHIYCQSTTDDYSLIDTVHITAASHETNSDRLSSLIYTIIPITSIPSLHGVSLHSVDMH